MKMEQAKKLNQSRQRRRGFTLTEIAIVLGIVGLILGAIWVAAAAVYNNLRISHMNTAVLQIVQGVRTLYGTQTSIANTDQTAALINAKVIPSDLVNAAGTGMINVWGGSMFVGGTTDQQGIAVTINGMPTSGCVGLVSGIGGTAHDASLGQNSAVANAPAPAVPAVAYGGVNVIGATPPVTGGTPFTTAAPSGTGCTANSNSNSVVFVFGLKG